MTLRPIRLGTLLACIVTPLAPVAAQDESTSNNQRHTSQPDRVALQALVNQFSRAVNAKDARALAECFTEDGEFTNPVGMTAKGRAAIEAFHAVLFARVRQPNTPSFYNVRLQVLDTSFRSLRPDVATVDIRWQQDGAIAPDGSPWGTRRGILSWVAVRDHGSWLVAVWHNLELPKE